MFLILALIILVLWLGGFALSVAGSLIHLLLVVAVILFIVHFVTSRSSSTL
jgi:uncharacterized membrane protein YtjA (UPF0391 family)